jgi:hypothetical protein
MTERTMRQASIDRFAPAPSGLATIRTCAKCGFLRYAALACAACEAAAPAQIPLEPLAPVVAPEPLPVAPQSPPERRPPGREICDPLPLRRQAARRAAG